MWDRLEEKVEEVDQAGATGEVNLWQGQTRSWPHGKTGVWSRLQDEGMAAVSVRRANRLAIKVTHIK